MSESNTTSEISISNSGRTVEQKSFLTTKLNRRALLATAGAAVATGIVGGTAKEVLDHTTTDKEDALSIIPDFEKAHTALKEGKEYEVLLGEKEAGQFIAKSVSWRIKEILGGKDVSIKALTDLVARSSDPTFHPDSDGTNFSAKTKIGYSVHGVELGGTIESDAHFINSPNADDIYGTLHGDNCHATFDANWLTRQTLKRLISPLSVEDLLGQISSAMAYPKVTLDLMLKTVLEPDESDAWFSTMPEGIKTDIKLENGNLKILYTSDDILSKKSPTQRQEEAE